MVKYFKDKCYFEARVQGQTIKARTACLILRYRDVNDNIKVLTILESDKNILEFPGGKVEPSDESIHDTLLRESWEEIVLKDNFHKHALQNWRKIHKKIKECDDPDSRFFIWVSEQLEQAVTTTYGNGPLRTVYFIVDITESQAMRLIQSHNMIPFDMNFISSVVSSNRKTKCKSNRYTRRTTYFHINGEVYRLRGRDFEGMFRFSNLLEKPIKKQLDWGSCRSMKMDPPELIPTIVQ